MTLVDLQRSFLDFLLDKPTHLPVTDQALPGLGVYHNAYRGQLVDCLRDSYERVWAWLGDDDFEEAARRHIADHPPTSWTLGDYGHGFAETLAMLYPSDAEIPEVAALDWALRRAFDGPDAPPFDASGLSDVDWDKAVIQFVPTLTLLPVATNCGAIWSAIASGGPVPAAEALPQPAWIRVWRTGMEPHFATIEADEHDGLQLARSGMPFARVCDRLAAERGVADVAEAVGRHLASWLQDQIVREIA